RPRRGPGRGGLKRVSWASAGLHDPVSQHEQSLFGHVWESCRAGPAFRLDAMDNVASALERLTTLASSSHVASLAAAFESAGFELALVGGSVRDAFLNRPVNDLDFTTNATPDQILEIVEPISSTQW